MYSICNICKRPYPGMNCLRCTQASITLESFGEETIGQSPKPATAILSNTPLRDDLAKLKLTDGQMFAVPKPICRIGQDITNDIVIADDESTARFHAQITFEEKESEYYLRDLGTKEGTFLNGTQIHLDQAIFDGDLIKVGKNKFYFVSDQPG